MEKKFSISTAFSEAWQAFKPNAWVLIGLTLAYYIVTFILGRIPFYIGWLLNLVLSIIFLLGFIRILLNTVAGEEARFEAFKQELPKFRNGLVGLIVMVILAGILPGIGGGLGAVLILHGHSGIGAILMALLYLAGIYIVMRIQFTFLAIVNEDLGAIDALKRSWQLTSGAELFKPLLLLLLLYIGLGLIGTICLGIGLAVTLPISGLVQVRFYQILSGQSQTSESVADNVSL
jgi:membrane-anchored glycerophosphoryl diester phosphodiesterase (GDPDase)